jgi:O-antigen/teichoic acid export membrane protein
VNRSKSFVTGLVIAGLLALGDIATPFISDGEHPPLVVGIACAVLGLITAAGVVRAWRGSRGWVTAIIVTRLLSAVAALPAFFVVGVPAGAVAAAAVGLAIALASVALVAPRLRRAALAGAAAS